MGPHWFLAAAETPGAGPLRLAENLYSLIETCKVNGVDAYRYLIALFKSLPLAQTVEDYEALLPWHFKNA